MILRPYQSKAVADVRAAFAAGHKRVLFVLPTGGGKTVCFTSIATQSAARGKRVCLLMHRAELISQTSRALGDVEHGIIQAGHRPQRHHAIQVASVQTLVNRTDRYNFDLIVVDEAHHTNATTYTRVLDAYPNARVLGVTATPVRTDGTGLREAGYTELILGPDVEWLMDGGYLCRADVYCPGGIDLTGIRRSMGDFNKRELAMASDKPTITGSAIDHYRKLADWQPAIAFCVSVAHAEHVAADFRAAGYTAASIDGKMSDHQRRTLIRDLGNGRLHVLTSCDLISEGVDVPVVTAGIMLRPTQSRGLWYQQIGRCLRPAHGKARAVILDHAGNTARHGLPWLGEQGWTLDGQSGRTAGDSETPVTVRICPECVRALPPLQCCPHCGYEFPVQAREIETVEGELVKLDATWQTAIKRTEEWQCKTLEEFQALAVARGYKPGWARIRYELKQKRRTAV